MGDFADMLVLNELTVAAKEWRSTASRCARLQPLQVLTATSASDLENQEIVAITRHALCHSRIMAI